METLAWAEVVLSITMATIVIAPSSATAEGPADSGVGPGAASSEVGHLVHPLKGYGGQRGPLASEPTPTPAWWDSKPLLAALIALVGVLLRLSMWKKQAEFESTLAARLATLETSLSGEIATLKRRLTREVAAADSLAACLGVLKGEVMRFRGVPRGNEERNRVATCTKALRAAVDANCHALPDEVISQYRKAIASAATAVEAGEGEKKRSAIAAFLTAAEDIERLQTDLFGEKR